MIGRDKRKNHPTFRTDAAGKRHYSMKAAPGSFKLIGSTVTMRVTRIKILDSRFTEKAFRPYALAIGQAALAWNTLHERLGYVFCEMLGDRSDRNVALWNAGIYDRPKRALLESVLNTMSQEERKAQADRYDGLTWLLKEIEKLEETRNNVIHAPLSLPISATMARNFGVRQYAAPDTSLRNRRALKLEGKDLLIEYRWLRDCSLTLRDYARRAERALTGERSTWPPIPRLPAREAQTRPPDRRAVSKARPLPPQSSAQ